MNTAAEVARTPMILDSTSFDVCDHIDAFLWDGNPDLGALFATVTRIITDMYQETLNGLGCDDATEAINYLDHHLESILHDAIRDVDPGAEPRTCFKVDRGALCLSLSALTGAIT